MDGLHYCKDEDGATLLFAGFGYDSALVELFKAKLASDALVPEASRARALDSLALVEKWERISEKDAFGRTVSVFSLKLPAKTNARSEPWMAVVKSEAQRALSEASEFHGQREWLNALAKKRGYVDELGAALKFEAVFSKPLSYASSLSWESADEASLLGCQEAYALFSPADGGYVEIPNSTYWSRKAPIARAKLFESAKAAKAWASAKGMRWTVSVVRVQVRLLAALEHAQSDAKGSQSLCEAIARAEAAELAAVLARDELASLREEFERLGLGGSGAPAQRGKSL